MSMTAGSDFGARACVSRACFALVQWFRARRAAPERHGVELQQKRGACWLVALVVLALGCFSAREPAPSGSLLAGKSPSAKRGVYGARSMTDGVAAFDGDDWETSLGARFEDEDASVTYDLGAETAIRALWFQADHNDDYRFMISQDGAVFEQLWDAPTVKAPGFRARSTRALAASGRYLRVEPVRGDGRYAISELLAFSDVPAVFPPELPRRRGAPLEVVVRTKVLLAAAAMVLCLLLAYRGAPWWWLAGAALLPLWTWVDVVLAMLRAWPLEQRQVSIVRAAAAAVAAAAIAREVFAPARYLAHRAVVHVALGAAALVAVLAFYNLGEPQFWDSEHRAATPIHLLDLRQYYGTAKYFDELGYRNAYAADVAAFIEDHPGVTLDSLRDTPMRDLDDHRISTVGAQRERIETIKQRFTPERWQEYKRDARYFWETMGSDEFLHYMIDFGGNATPVWIGVAHLMFSAFQANTTAFLLTGLLDPLLFFLTFAAIWRCYGYRTMAVVMVVFGANDFIMYGTNWGGATLRHDWLMFIGLGACALKRERWALGGVLLALSTLIRAFPALTLVSATFPALWWATEHKRAELRWPSWREIWVAQQPILRVLGAALLTALLLVAVTSARWSFPTWVDWLAKVSKLNADAHGNSVALRNLVAGWEAGHQQLLAARWPLLAAGILFFSLAVLLSCRNKSLDRAAIFGLLLVPVVFYAANYYLHIVCFLPLLALERRRQEIARGAPPVSTADAWLWLTLLGLCVAQYWTVLVTEFGLHFHLATVLLFGALSAILLVQLRADVREGRLPFIERFFAPPGQDEPARAERPLTEG
jgi:hypothetical protein